jgi:antibiotic biosynthesis monooxygenase (ABM) superfamily enzyme
MPRRWKQYLVTWSAIYPLILGVPPLIVPGLHRLDITSNYLEKLFVSGIVVGLMVYVVMPRYTKLVHDWLSS